jgi:hypothetical protein
MNNNDAKPTLEELISMLDPNVQDAFRSVITNIAMELSALRKEVQEIKSNVPQDGFVPIIDKNKWILGSNKSNKFDPEHYPVGSAVMISWTNARTCIITGYTNDNRIMELIDVSTYNNDCHIAITPDKVFGDDAAYHITRLLPEPPELENMDYESALKEVTENG